MGGSVCACVGEQEGMTVSGAREMDCEYVKGRIKKKTQSEKECEGVDYQKAWRKEAGRDAEDNFK